MDIKFNKKIKCFIGGFLLSLIFFSRTEASVLTDSITYKKRNLSYAYYIPDETPKKTIALVLVNGLNGSGENMITESWIKLANSKKWPIIAPSFKFEGEQAFQQQKSYQYPKAWSGSALKEILKKFSNQGYQISGLNMVGFSAGAQFVERYSLLFPKQVKKCAIVASGGNDEITKKSSVHYFYAIGANDQYNRKQFAQDFKKQAQQKKISVVYKEYQGVGHDFSNQMQTDIIQFLSGR